jgi:hypothetical protein
VTLRVLTQAGGECHLYPIEEFLPDHSQMSDAEGRLVFHHVSEGFEFGGRAHCNMLDMWFGETHAPQYLCVFSVVGREVHRVRFDDLRPWRERDRLPRVTRPWQYPVWPMHEYEAHRGEWDAHRFRIYDGDKNGELYREERIAVQYFDRMLEDGKREVEFLVVERTITVEMP